MRIVCIGGGPAGLYFALLMKQAHRYYDITVVERNRLDDTFGFGVVFSDATQDNLAAADPQTHDEMMRQAARWDDVDIHYHGHLITSTGHGFSGMSRQKLLAILAGRCDQLGVNLEFETEVQDPDDYKDADLVVAADGFSSIVRAKYASAFRPSIDWRPNKFVWLGSTRSFKAFTFYFKRDKHGLWRVHAYQYEPGHSTFIVEATEDTWRATGLGEEEEDRTIAFCEELFAAELEGHHLLKNKSIWRNFPTVKNEKWSHKNIVLLGDAAHTAHFSVGSGTKLAMEDCIALSTALNSENDVSAALVRYEEERRPVVESLQRAADVSLQWFENTERYMELEPTQFAFNLLTRSLRVTHENLRIRDPKFIDQVDTWFAARATERGYYEKQPDPAPPPLFTPFELREMRLANRVVVSPMCQYSAQEGTPNDWHLVHLGSRALGGAGLVITEMTDVSADARISPGCAGMYNSQHAEQWKRITDFVHEYSDAKIALQLGHAGRKGSTRLMWEGMDEPLRDGSWPIMAPSAIPYLDHSQVPKEMTRADMDEARDAFIRSAAMADEAGFDMLEIHFAHGYLLASFISPLTNIRTDEYGGELSSRLRFPLEVFDGVRSNWPEHKPISVRISAVDWTPDGTAPEDAVEVARQLKEHGCDIIDVSAGQTVPYAKPAYGRQFQTPFSDLIRHEVGIPTMAVGNISSYEDVNSILAAGRADLCVMARAHLWDPYWTRHAAYELGYELPWPDQYSTLNEYAPRFK